MCGFFSFYWKKKTPLTNHPSIHWDEDRRSTSLISIPVINPLMFVLFSLYVTIHRLTYLPGFLLALVDKEARTRWSFSASIKVEDVSCVKGWLWSHVRATQEGYGPPHVRRKGLTRTSQKYKPSVEATQAARAAIGPLTKTRRRTINVHDYVEASAGVLELCERGTMKSP